MEVVQPREKKTLQYTNSNFGAIGISVEQGKMCFLSHSGERLEEFVRDTEIVGRRLLNTWTMEGI